MKKSQLFSQLGGLTLCLCLLLSANISEASDSKGIHEPGALTHCDTCLWIYCLDRFLITPATASQGVAACSARIRVPDDSVMLVGMDIRWKPAFLRLDSLVSPYILDTIYEQTDSSVWFEIDVPDQQYPDTTVVAKLWFTTQGCFSSTIVNYRAPCVRTHYMKTDFHRTSPWPFWGGNVTNPPSAHTMSPTRDSGIVNDTLEIPVLFTSEKKADLGFGSTWLFPENKLQFLSVKKGSLLNFNPTGTVKPSSTGDDTIYISYPDTVTKTTNPTPIFYILFKNIMTTRADSAKVIRLTDTLKICQQDSATIVKSIIATPETGTAKTFYFAVMQFKDQSAYTNRNVDWYVLLQNNFVVKLDTADTVTFYRIDQTAWNNNIIKWLNWRNINGYNFTKLPVPGNAQFVNWSLPNTVDIPIFTAYPREIAVQECSTKSAGSQVGNIIYPKVQLVDANAPYIVIKPDSGLTLLPGTFTVTNPPGGNGSCPFLYVWNGSTFEEDNSILTQTEFSPKEQNVTDHYLIRKPVVAKDKQYHFQLRELAEEKSFIDKIELLTVDHPVKQKIALTQEGKVHFVGEEFSPVSVIDDKGVDQRDKVLTSDGILFTAKEKGHLILTYTIPDKNRLGDVIFAEPDAPKRECDADKRISPNGRREPVLQTLRTEIEDSNGQWVEIAITPPRDNYAESHWLIDPNSVQVKETFRVRISWEKSYSADQIKFYSVSDQTPVVKTLSPTSVFHTNSGSMLDLLAEEDRQFATLMRGEKLDLFFPAENLSLPEGYTRDFIVKASGYYIPYAPEPAALIPDRFELKDNYPNPFNATTEISFALPQESDVKLAIYNVTGQKVKTLCEGRKMAGMHRVVWDGKNEKGEMVASGMYFYTIKAGTYIETKRMTLLK